MAEKFNRKATNVEKWTSGRAGELQRNDDLEEANLAGIQVRMYMYSTASICVNKYLHVSTNVLNLLFVGFTKDPSNI